MASTELYKSFPDGVWLSRAMIAMQASAVPLTIWFKPVCVCAALFW